jgi:hypothetical protein
MKRDMNLVREILLGIEANPASERWDWPSAFKGRRDEHEVSEHLRLLKEAELIEGKGGFYELTWEGNEFLDAARNSKIWGTLKEKLLGEAVSCTLSAIIKAAHSLIEQ